MMVHRQDQPEWVTFGTDILHHTTGGQSFRVVYLDQIVDCY